MRLPKIQTIHSCNKNKLRRLFKIYAILILIGIISIVISSFTDRAVCIFYTLMGIPSPSCGMTRAFESLMQFNIRDAFFYNPLFFMVPIIPFFCAFEQNKMIIITIIAFIAVWIVRLYLFFPDIEPFVFNKEALLPRLYELLKQL